MQGFLDLRGLVGAQPSLEQGYCRGGEAPLQTPQCGTNCLEILRSLTVESSSTLLGTNSSYTLEDPHSHRASSEADPLPQLAANAVLFLCGNVAGAYHKALMERALRATFREALRSLHSRRRLDTEKKHQVLEPTGGLGRTRV